MTQLNDELRQILSRLSPVRRAAVATASAQRLVCAVAPEDPVRGAEAVRLCEHLWEALLTKKDFGTLVEEDFMRLIDTRPEIESDLTGMMDACGTALFYAFRSYANRSIEDALLALENAWEDAFQRAFSIEDARRGHSVEGVDSLYQVAEHGAIASRERSRQMDDLRIASSEDSDASVIDNLLERARRSPSLTPGEMAELRR